MALFFIIECLVFWGASWQARFYVKLFIMNDMKTLIPLSIVETIVHIYLVKQNEENAYTKN